MSENSESQIATKNTTVAKAGSAATSESGECRQTPKTPDYGDCKAQQQNVWVGRLNSKSYGTYVFGHFRELYFMHTYQIIYAIPICLSVTK